MDQRSLEVKLMSKRSASVFNNDILAGLIVQDEEDFTFSYDPSYDGGPVSLTMPVRKEPYKSDKLFPFFDGLLPEGWQLEALCRKYKLDKKDRMGLLLRAGGDFVGTVSIKETTDTS